MGKRDGYEQPTNPEPEVIFQGLILTPRECTLLYNELKNNWLARETYAETRPLVERLYRASDEFRKTNVQQKPTKDIQDHP